MPELDVTYMLSDKIDVFPATRRTFQSSHSRQVTEASIAGIVNRLIDKDGFVVTNLPNNAEQQNNMMFEFNIHGYYFRASLGDLVSPFNNDVYGIITIDNGNVYEFNELVGSDENNLYKGIRFSESDPSNAILENEYYLHLLSKVDSVWQVPERSKIKFLPSSVDIELIDGGEILALPPV